jgi:hypothetical protein
MTNLTGHGTQESLVLGYFADGTNAYRAINELIDEGFSPAEIGAAFRALRAGSEPAAVGEMRNVRELTERNPALSGSAGGPASGDESVTPAGLAPGSGNAFPGAPSTPGPIPGAEIPSTLKHDLPETLPHELPSTLRSGSPSTMPTSGVLAGKGNLDDTWVQHLKNIYGGSGTTNSTGETAKTRNTTRASDQKFGTGEATLGLFPEHAWSEPAFEGSFTSMGLSPEEARSLSSELGRGGAVVTVSAEARSSLAEAILERNHARVRFEYSASSTTPSSIDRESPVQIYGSMRNYYQPDEELQRKAS